MKSNQLQILIVLTFIGMFAGIFNGYPLVFSDTGTYIGSGFEGDLPADRPLFYGWLVRFCSLGISLWWVILVQNVLLSWAYLSLWQKVTTASSNWTVFTWILLVALTPLSWYSCQIMPDIFTAILSILLLKVMYENRVQIPEIALIFLCLIMHGSHIPFYLLFLFGLALFFRKFLKDQAPFLIRICIPLFLAIAVMMTTSKIKGGGWNMVPGTHMFLMGNMVDAGILEAGVLEYCSGHESVFCNMSEDFPKNSREFLWSGPISSSKDWISHKSEAWAILGTTLSSPGRIFQWAHHSFWSSLSMMTQNTVGSGLVSSWYREAESPPHMRIAQYFPNELAAFRSSRQNGNLWGQELHLTVLSGLQNYWFLLGICFLLLNWTKIRAQLQDLLVTAGLIIFSHAILVSSLANAYDRLQSRVSWIFIMLVLIAVIENIIARRGTKY